MTRRGRVRWSKRPTWSPLHVERYLDAVIPVYHRCSRGGMSEPAADPKQEISNLQAQFDQLNRTLQHCADRQKQLQPNERRLTELMQRGAEIVDRLATTDERHAHVV